MRKFNGKKGFTLLEAMVVVIIIGILSALGWSSMSELIRINNAKEAARMLTAFAERSIAEGKTRKEEITISVSGNIMEAKLQTGTVLFSQTFANGFREFGNPKPAQCIVDNAFINTVTSQVQIGLSGIDGPGCFVVCIANGNYCGSAVKTTDKNSFVAYIMKKGNWEAL